MIKLFCFHQLYGSAFLSPSFSDGMLLCNYFFQFFQLQRGRCTSNELSIVTETETSITRVFAFWGPHYNSFQHNDHASDVDFRKRKLEICERRAFAFRGLFYAFPRNVKSTAITAHGTVGNSTIRKINYCLLYSFLSVPLYLNFNFSFFIFLPVLDNNNTR